MQLTNIQSLSKDYTSNDVIEMAAVMQSTHRGSPSGEVQWAKVKDSDALAWTNTKVASSLKQEFETKRMSAMLDLSDKDMPSEPCAEHLIIRDLDMEHVGPTTENEASGRVVAHADWRYTPCFDRVVPETPNGKKSMEDKNSYPEGLNIELHKLIGDGIACSSATHFRNLPFFYLLGISTLTPSHLRRGIAKQLVQWIDPYVNHYSIPVVLYASPLGLHLYRSCGFKEYRDLDVAIDLEKWSVKEVHRHVVMILWPRDESLLSDAWKAWKSSHKEGLPSIDATN